MGNASSAHKRAALNPYLKGGERYASWVNVKVTSKSSLYMAPYNGGSKIRGIVQYVDPAKNTKEQMGFFPESRIIEVKTQIPCHLIKEDNVIFFETLVLNSQASPIEACDPRPPEAVFGRGEHGNALMSGIRSISLSSGSTGGPKGPGSPAPA
jgi:hypothetical protein